MEIVRIKCYNDIIISTTLEVRKMKLAKKMTFSFIFAILVSTFIISFISNYMINNRFEIYLFEEQENKLGQISEEINRLYSESDYTLYQNDIDSYASLEDLYIEIKDLDNNTLYSSSPNSGMGGMHNNGHMGRGMMGMHQSQPGNYVEKSYPLLQKGKALGILVLGYIDNAYMTESAIVFKDTLSKSFLFSGILTILFGIIISIYLSKSLTNPLILIRNSAVEIQKGNLDSRSKVNTKTTEIVELSDSINYLAETLSDQEDIRKRYASDISHELRTPITTLKSHLEGILDGVWDNNEEHLNILLMEVHRLAGLVDDLKTSFSSEEYKLNLNRSNFNMSKEVHNVIDTFQPIYTKVDHSLTSSIKEDIIINMDLDKLKQIIYNLLSNSIKYLNKNGTVFISLEVEKNQVILTITDNGIGIEKEDLPYIFDRFYRSDSSRNRDSGGTGLGLSIVRSFVEAHSGNIYIDSVYGEGAEIRIVLPLEA